MNFRTLFLLFLLAELASLTAYFFPTLNTVGFFVIVVAALIFSLRRLEYGLYFVLADLILGGKSGALFSFEYSGFFISLRMALFMVVMGVWLGKVTGNLFSRHPERSEGSRSLWYGILRRFAPQNDMLFGWSLFGLAVVWGIIVGLVRGNNFGDLFLDVNGYLYGALILPVWWAFRSRHSERSVSGVKNPARQNTGSFADAQDDLGWRVFFTATTLLALKTLFAVYWFTHAGNNFIAANLLDFYRWVRDTGVGEITWLEGNFARVFFQSQVFSIAAFFVLLGEYIRRLGLRSNGGRASLYTILLLLTLNASVIIVSLSRSFWVGIVIGFGVLCGAILLNQKVAATFRLRLRRLKPAATVFVGSIVGGVIILLLVARFPLPRPSPIDFGSAAGARFAFESAAASRWNLFPELWHRVAQHPVAGSGFGRTVTYISNDPRIRLQSPTGEYTTYALEWGWLDFWLKLGLIGLIGPIGLIGALAWRLYKTNRTALAVLAALASIHVFTPYLNHPLGLGMLTLLTVLPVYGIVDQRGFETASRVLTQRA